MKTLVIHPKDVTTDFLSAIYEGKDWTVITDNIPKSHLRKAIRNHERIIMLGHGSGQGLFGFKRFVLDSTYVYLLRTKRECVYIWCNANKFVDRYGLSGFYTGMIISDYMEALDYAVKAHGDHIDNSNVLFATTVRDAIDLDSAAMCKQVIERYDNDTAVVDFNRNNIFSRL